MAQSWGGVVVSQTELCFKTKPANRHSQSKAWSSNYEESTFLNLEKCWDIQPDIDNHKVSFTSDLSVFTKAHLCLTWKPIEVITRFLQNKSSPGSICFANRFWAPSITRLWNAWMHHKAGIEKSTKAIEIENWPANRGKIAFQENKIRAACMRRETSGSKIRLMIAFASDGISRSV